MHRSNIEVTRLRATTRVADAIVAKMRQLPPGIPNVIALVRGAGSEDERIGAVVRRLKQSADRREDRVFARAGFATSREFYARYVRVSAIVLVRDGGEAAGELWLNAEARSPLPADTTRALAKALDVLPT